MNRFRHRGVSLIETIACVAIVATLATGVVGMMRGSVRAAAAARIVNGAPAQGRQALRFVTDHFSQLKAAGVTVMGARGSRWTLSDGTSEQMELRPSAGGAGRDLVLVKADKSETVLVVGSARRMEVRQHDFAGEIVGLDFELELQLPDAQAGSYRQRDQAAVVRTSYCFAPMI